MGRVKRWLVAAALFFAGCGGPKPGDIPGIHFGSDTCARCGMVLSEERFTSGYVDSDGRSVVFDDVGEFIAAVRSQPALARIAFVHDGETSRWLRASEAFFIRIPPLATPMGTGFAAFALEAQARSFGKRFGAQGRPMTLAALSSDPPRLPPARY